MPTNSNGNCVDCGHPAMEHDGHTGRCRVPGCRCATCDWAIDQMADNMIHAIAGATGIPEDQVPAAFEDGRLWVTGSNIRFAGGMPSGCVVETYTHPSLVDPKATDG